MSATVKEVAALADISKFFKDTGADSTSGECHNALTWLAIQIKKAGISDYNIHLCTGVFARYDHSWIQIENIDTEEHTIIDMTVDQFGESNEKAYIGPVSPAYVIHNAVLLSDQDNISDFICNLG